ncbi:MAG: trimeric intracellular cation channel family protein, partial [Conexivisphaera sp.]
AMFLGAVTALGGGVIRDLIAGVIPPTVFRYEAYAGVSLLTGLVAFWVLPPQMADRRSFLYADALGLAVFSALGADVAFSRGLGPLGVPFAAMITGCGGGIIRDLLAGDVPVVMHREVYATLGLLGGFVYYVLGLTGVNRALDAIAVTGIVFALRALAVERGWSLPRRG